MEDLKKLKEVLDAPIETRVLPQTHFPYVPISALRERLNSAFMCLWDIEILASEIIEDNILLRGKLIGHVGDKTISKEAYGSAPIHRFNSGANKGQPTNIGDAYNNAVYDFLKCASKLMCISNKEMDVIRDPKTGKFVRVDGLVSSVSDSAVSTIQNKKQPDKKQEELKTDNKQAAIEKTNKTVELKKRLEALKNKTNTAVEPIVAEKKEEQVKEEPVIPQEPENNSVVDHGFDYDELNGTTDSPKNTQKLVILNLAKMKGVTIEDYIKQIIGKQKSIDDLTASEAGLIVRSGLTSTTFKE